MYLLGAGGGAGGGLSTIIIFVVFIGLMYFMMIRPQKKQQDKRKQMMDALKKGDSVVTIGGLHGVIDSIDEADKSVTLDCDGVYLVFNRTAIGKVVESAGTVSATPASDTKEDSTADVDDKASTKEEAPANDDTKSDETDDSEE